MKLFKGMFTLVLSLFTFLSVSAQQSISCNDAFYYARDLYYKGQFESVHSYLNVCVNEFFTARDYYLTNNQEQVFKVYKLIITSYYDNDYDYLADEKINELLNFFTGYDSNAVLERLGNTAF